MNKKVTILLVSLFVLLFISSISFAKPTKIVIRVISKDAKFIGTSMGGAFIKLKDVATGEILAKGITSGTTGSTERIMKTPKERGKFISDEKSAKFTATIDINEPTLVEITACGPVVQRQSANKISITQWILPGKDIVQGDALMLELPGFAVDVLSPPTHIKLKGTPQKIDIRANVIMMCGCPIEPNGVWDANKFEVKAIVKKNGKVAQEIDMKYAGKTSQFEGEYEAKEKGMFEIIVYAFDESNGNTGLDKTSFVVN